MVVERDLAIRAFTPEDYYEVIAHTLRLVPSSSPASESAGKSESYQGVWFRGERPEPKAKRLPADGEEAQRIVAQANS